MAAVNPPTTATPTTTTNHSILPPGYGDTIVTGIHGAQAHVYIFYDKIEKMYFVRGRGHIEYSSQPMSFQFMRGKDVKTFLRTLFTERCTVALYNYFSLPSASIAITYYELNTSPRNLFSTRTCSSGESLHVSRALKLVRTSYSMFELDVSFSEPGQFQDAAQKTADTYGAYLQYRHAADSMDPNEEEEEEFEDDDYTEWDGTSAY